MTNVNNTASKKRPMWAIILIILVILGLSTWGITTLMNKSEGSDDQVANDGSGNVS